MQNAIKKVNLDSVQMLSISENLKSKLINSGYTTISKLKSSIDDSDGKDIKDIPGIGSIIYRKIYTSVLEFEESKDHKDGDKEDVNKDQLGYKLVDFICDEITNPDIAKYKIKGVGSEYPNSNILYDDDSNVYFEVSSLAERFNKYVEDKFNVILTYRNHNTDYFKIAISFLVYQDLVFYREKENNVTNKSIRYSFNKFPKIINNGNLYIEVYHDKLEIFTNKNIGIKVSDEIVNDYVLNSLFDEVNAEDSASDFNDAGDKTTINDEDKIYRSKDHSIVVINSCRNIMQDKYIVVFSVITRTSRNPYKFDTDIVVGTYQFNSRNKYNGEILISKEFTGDINFVKNRVIKYL